MKKKLLVKIVICFLSMLILGLFFYGWSIGKFNFGKKDSGGVMNKEEVWMTIGETENLTVNLESIDIKDAELTWTSSNKNMASVSTNGVITALSLGESMVKVTDRKHGITIQCKVKVIENEKKFVIGIFWPPVKDFVNEEQYDLLKNANINYIEMTHTSDLTDKETNLKMLKLSAQRGMKVSICDNRFIDFKDKTDEEIDKVISEYKNLPGLGGYYILDEPINPNPYARIYKQMLKSDPSCVPHLNLYPIESFKDSLNDFVNLIGKKDFQYISYDSYPFYDDIVNPTLFETLNIMREVGLNNDVKSAVYIQSIGFQDKYRRPTENEIRYHVSSSLAYGFKKIVYFTWWTPTGRSEVFTNSIVDPQGKPTDLYAPVTEINRQVMNLGPVLMKLDAVKIYHSGNAMPKGDAVPKDLFFKTSANEDAIISLMKDKTNGRNYIMVVNKSYKDSKDISFIIDKSINSLTEVSKDTGKDVTVANYEDGKFTDNFIPGEAKLYALPEGANYINSAENEPANNTNLALGKSVWGASSFGQYGWFFSKLTDGKKFSTTQNWGWKSSASNSENVNEWVIVDLGKERDFNRIDLYPAGEKNLIGSQFPKDFNLLVSIDNENWKEVINNKDYPLANKQVPSFKFDTITARYLKIEISKSRELLGNFEIQFGEIEVYNDDGNAPAPAKITYVRPASITGVNIAKGMPINTSSAVKEPGAGWADVFLVDGKKGSKADTIAWSSKVGLHTGKNPYCEEWAFVFLGDEFMVNKVTAYPRADGASAGMGFPEEYKIEVSLDGKTWTTVKTITGDKKRSADARVIEFEPIKAMYVKFVGTKLTLGGNNVDGYLLQLGELEVYGDYSAPINN